MWVLSTNPHGVINQKTNFDIFTSDDLKFLLKIADALQNTVFLDLVCKIIPL